MKLADFESIPGMTPRMAGRLPQLIKGLLNHPVKDPVYSASIEKALDLTGPEVRAGISYLRTLHMPIGSGRLGYFWAANSTELDKTTSHLTGRLKRINDTLNGLKRAKFGLKSVDDIDDYMIKTGQTQGKLSF